MEWNSLEGISLIFVILIGLLVLGLYIWSIVWSYRDAERRGVSGILVALMVALLSWPIGLIVWLVIRETGIVKKQHTH